jgi:hypothetical protein
MVATFADGMIVGGRGRAGLFSKGSAPEEASSHTDCFIPSNARFTNAILV